MAITVKYPTGFSKVFRLFIMLYSSQFIIGRVLLSHHCLLKNANLKLARV